ncbi:dihydropteroate synthase, partial [Bacillus velezensis]|uniref:dihydropteroate synthase n=1 Tax=Bacillus velezensis TaxID=492670 RepID=UPI0021B50FAA
MALVRDGADLVDVGGESTRPGAEPVDPAQERRRILPVIRQLTERGVVVSVDTLHPDTAEAALQAGAGIVND